MQKRTASYVGACGAIVVAVSLCHFFAPAHTAWLASELGPLQLAQAAVLTLACLLLVVRLSRRGLRNPASPALAVLATLLFAFAWREIEIDNELWNVHAFSWKYLWSKDVPWTVKCGLGIPSLGLVIALTTYLLRTGPQRLLASLSQVCRQGVCLLLVGIAAMGIGQLWDKGRTIAKHCGIDHFMHSELETSPNPLPEETLELVGELLLLFAALEILRDEKRRHAEAQTARRTQHWQAVAEQELAKLQASSQKSTGVPVERGESLPLQASPIEETEEAIARS